MSVTAPETEARNALISMLQTEFTPEGFAVKSDRLHESVGDAGTRIGVSPDRTRPARNEYELNSQITVQFYGKWNKEINPDQQVDPTKIETFAERFRRAIRTHDPKTSKVWFFKVIDLSYPEDPTGNKTRFEATVVAVGQNPALVETTG